MIHAAMCLLSSVAVAAGLAPTVTIAPGIHMPMMLFGIANHTLWIEAGGRGLDTGYVYGDANQREVGQAVLNSGLPRSEFFVITKMPCCPSSFPDPICQQGRRNTTDDLKHSMSVLGLEYVDLVTLHWPCDNLKDSVAAYRYLEEFHSAGKARALGVSNFNATMLDAFVPKVSVKPVLNQVGFSIAGHSMPRWGRDDATIAKAKELSIMPMAYSPFGQYTQVNVLNHPTVLSIAAAHGKSAAQVALRWILQQNISLVTRSGSYEHAVDDLSAFAFNLTNHEMKELEAIQLSETLHI